MGNTPGVSEGTFFLLRYGLFAALLLHLPYAGMVAAGSAVSLVTNLLGRDKGREDLLRLSREVMGTVPLSPPILPLAAALILLPVALLSRRILAGSDPLGWPPWALAALLFLAGAALLGRYRAGLALPPDRQGAAARLGGAGLAAAASALFLVSAGTSVLLNPEKLAFLAARPFYLVSWNAVVRFLLFLALFVGLAGSVILLYLGQPREGASEGDAAFRRYAFARGAFMALMAALPVPLLVVLHLATLPDVALSWGVVGLAASMVIVALAASLPLCLSFRRGEGSPGGPAFVSYLLILSFLLLGDYVALGNAYEGRRGPPIAAAAAGEPAAGKAPAAEAIARGKAVFERTCSPCHRFDARLVGPPLDETVPKYAGDVEKLKSFIRSPVKVRPDYPPMPGLGLPEEEIDAVARYLIAEAGGGRRR